MGDGSLYEDLLEVEHSYTDAGRFEIYVSFDDGDGAIGDTGYTLDVGESAPYISSEPSEVRGQEGQALSFSVRVEPGVRGRNIRGELIYDEVVIEIEESGPLLCEVLPDLLEEAVFSVDCSWEPGFYDGGEYEVVLLARGALSGLSRRREIPVRIEDNAQPSVAALGLSGSGRARLTLFRFEREDGDMQLRPLPELDLGQGLGEMLLGPESRHLFVGLPDSGGVGVVKLNGTPELLRLIPTGPGTTSLARGADRLWALSSSSGRLSIIHEENWKVLSEISTGINEPLTMTWIPRGFGDLVSALLLISTAQGELHLLEPSALASGQQGLLASTQLGGRLQHISLDMEQDLIFIHDSQGRRLFQLRGAALGQLPPNLEPELQFSLRFAATDLLARGGRLYLANPRGLIELEGEELQLHSNLNCSALAGFEEGILEGAELLFFDGTRLRAYDAEFNPLLSARGLRFQRLAGFIALE